MKRISLYIASAIALLFSACTKDLQHDNIANGICSATLEISLEQTRTSLGSKQNKSYPVYWSEGDRIAINGKCSNDAIINPEDKTRAVFSTEEEVSYPFEVTYPYTSSTSAQAPMVLFPAEQHYTENSFEKDSAPMCGHLAEAGEKNRLNHLAGVLRVPVVADKSGRTLSKVVITSTSKISGLFYVDCTSASISPSKECGNSITYTLPDNFQLSTIVGKPLYISIPAVDVGKCSVAFIDQLGREMVFSWEPSTPIEKGIVREFKSITFTPGAKGALEPLGCEEDNLIIPFDNIFGYVKDSNGQPIKGVPVSDGFSIVTTDANGYYAINASTNTWYIYITMPSEYEIPINEFGQPCFYKRLQSDKQQYDFTLTPIPGGKEKKFALFTFGDPQVSSEAALNRFRTEAIPGIKAHADLVSKEMPCYGITLGDIISMGSSRDSSPYREPMRDGFAANVVGMPVFQVMGNHDCNFFNANKPAFPNEYNSEYNLVVQRHHEEMFGPINYSFNRGDVHIIGMRNIYYPNNNSQSSKLGFLDSQVEWLKQDLALVPKDHTVLFCVHIPMMKDNTLYNTPEVMTLLNTFTKMHIISGHRHFIWNYEYAKEGSKYKNLEEHVMGAVCGAWWKTNMCGDGAPCGFGVFVGEGKDLTDWYHVGYHNGMHERSHQMRLYRGNAICGAAAPEGNTVATKGYYAFNFSEDTLLANVYFADSKWTMKVYEDGVYSGNMTKVPYVRRPLFSTFTGNGSWESPFMPQTSTSNDTYVTGLMLGIQGYDDSTGGARDECYHMYQYKLKNKNAKIKVEAIDRWGNVYTETKITEGTDYSITAKK